MFHLYTLDDQNGVKAPRSKTHALDRYPTNPLHDADESLKRAQLWGLFLPVLGRVNLNEAGTVSSTKLFNDV
jgi:hypothetical protein